MKPVPPFANVGIDYFGPFTVKGEVQKRIHGKGYGVLFVCMMMRGVYADVTPNYTTDSFLQALRRFGNRHGWPSKIHSDQGTELKAASSELKGIVDSLDVSCVHKFVTSKGVKWSFAPPDSPWMNGVTESLVKFIKRSLNTVIGDQVLSFSELQTTMFECAQLVNQHPISRSLGIMYKLRPFLPLKIMKNVYYSLIYSNLVYGIEVWGSACKTELNKLLVLQKRAMRLMTYNDQYPVNLDH